ncbi:MAG: hypothetical protein JWR15_2424 [Prosthecobacter sp.]|nr:hypothetical protein [Prosthecobacter sp.]
MFLVADAIRSSVPPSRDAWGNPVGVYSHRGEDSFPMKKAHLILLLLVALTAHAAEPLLIRSAQSGAWSDSATWAGGKVPPAGASVQVRSGHKVAYDLNSTQVIRAVFVAGTLSFARDRDTQLNVGLIKIQPGDDTSEEGFNCDAHLPEADPSKPKPALEVGTAEQPVDAKHTALIRLVYLEGMDAQSCPAIVCCGGRMEFHGAEMNHTWVKLGATAKPGEITIPLAEAVSGWRVGDHVFITSTTRQTKRPPEKTFRPTVRDLTQTEERIIRAVSGTQVTLDQPLAFEHLAEGAYRGEIANLSRNVIVESADPAKSRGHTMYHRGSSGRSVTRSSATSARWTCWAATASISTLPGTPCAEPP